MAKVHSRALPLWGLFGAVIIAGVWVGLLRSPRKPMEKNAALTNGAPMAGFSRQLLQAPPRSDTRVLAEHVCGTCHLFPEPEIADQFTWTNAILPRMSGWLGYETVDWANQPGSEEALASGKIPSAPVIDQASLQAIYQYYMRAAPLEAPAQGPKPTKRLGLKHFRVRLGAPPGTVPSTTLVRIDERSRQLWIGDGHSSTLSVLDASGGLIDTLSLSSPVVHLLERSDALYATCIGHLQPSDLAEGEVIRVQPAGAGHLVDRVLLPSLRRPVACEAADLNGDNLEDLVVASFGNILGRFSWYEQTPSGQYVEHVLIDRPGAVACAVQDLDEDGLPDILVAMAQAQEGIFVLLNRGQGRFEEKPILRAHPAWGFTHMEMVDFDGDGDQDLLVTNGDNGDNVNWPNCLKAYHGVRLYRNEGQGDFREAWFYPMYGAYRAVARDFDLDGDLDIAAVSFFPDYSSGSNESFVYLENQGGLRFEPFTFAQQIAGRWITLDAGDLDGDGDVDIVLGANDRSFGDVPSQLEESWKARGPAMIELVNTVRPR